MSYLTVLPLADAKNYLKVEHSDTDSEITAMIQAAGEHIEITTGHILYSRDQTYRLDEKDCIRVHDYPITAVVKGLDKDGADVALTRETNYDYVERPLHTYYYGIDSDAVSLVLTAGYVSASDVPKSLVEAMKMIVKALYYSTDAETIDDALPLSVKMLMSKYKRFVL